jgi:hypothetical protein
VLNVALRGRRVVGVFFLFSFSFPQLQGWQRDYDAQHVCVTRQFGGMRSTWSLPNSDVKICRCLPNV